MSDRTATHTLPASDDDAGWLAYRLEHPIYVAPQETFSNRLSDSDVEIIYTQTTGDERGEDKASFDQAAQLAFGLILVAIVLVVLWGFHII